MDRQGNRVRFTRLGVTLVLLALLGAFGVFAAKRWWERMTNDTIAIDESTHPSSDGSIQLSTDPSAQQSGAPSSHAGDEGPKNLEGSGQASAPPPSTIANGPPATSDSHSSELAIEEQPPAGLHPLDGVLDLAKEALINHRAKHFDFTAKLSKSERINNRLLPTSLMAMKLRYRPLEASEAIRGTDLYFKFIEPRTQAGREVIYAPLKYDGKIKAHEGGFLGLITVELTPNSQLAMRGNRYPLTEAGIEKLIVKLIEKGERDRARGACIVKRFPDELVGDVPCELIEVIHPQKTYHVGEQEFPHEFYKAQIWFDMKELVPLKYASYLWPETPEGEPLLEEEYIYSELKLNVGLEDKDFDIENKEYAFP